MMRTFTLARVHQSPAVHQQHDQIRCIQRFAAV